MGRLNGRGGQARFLCVLFALTLFALFKEALQALHYRVI